MCGALLALALALPAQFSVAQDAPPPAANPAKHRDADKPKKKPASSKPSLPAVAAPKPAPQRVAPSPPSPGRPSHEENEAKSGRGTEPLDTSAPPPRLPAASREKMHACALEWAKLKQTTRGTLPLWRDFATACLTR
jgi:hypothetical protein